MSSDRTSSAPGAAHALALASACALLGSLFAAASCPLLKGGASAEALRTWGIIAAALTIVPPVGVLIAARHRLIRGGIQSSLWALVIGCSGWVLLDTPRFGVARYPIVHATPDEATADLMRYAHRRETPQRASLKAKEPNTLFAGANPEDHARWREFVLRSQGDLVADSVLYADERKWLLSLNRHVAFPDVDASRADADFPMYALWRTIALQEVALASILALDGRGDEALLRTLPVIELAQKLEDGAQTLNRARIARAILRIGMAGAGFVIETSAPSRESIWRMQQLLARGGGTAGLEQMLTIEIAHQSRYFDTQSFGDICAGHFAWTEQLRVPLNIVGRALFQRHATSRLHSDFLDEIRAAALQRSPEKLRTAEQRFDQSIRAPSLRNVGGRLLLRHAAPPYEKLVRSYWEVESMRGQLMRVPLI